MWTDPSRAQHARTDLALPRDLTDAEGAALEPFRPPPSVMGRPRKWPLPRILEAILYLLRGGSPWRMPLPCCPPVSTVRRWFYLRRDNGLWPTINHAPPMISREAEGRKLLLSKAAARTIDHPRYVPGCPEAFTPDEYHWSRPVITAANRKML